MSTLDQLLSEIEQRANAANPGDWYWHGDYFDGHIRDANGTSIFGGEPHEGMVEPDDPNVIFTIDARTTVPRLVKALKACIKRCGGHIAGRYIANIIERDHAIAELHAELTAILEGEDEA